MQLENKKQELQAKLDKSAQDTDGAEKWLSLVRKYTDTNFDLKSFFINF